MTTTPRDIPLHAAGFDFGIRVYPAERPSGPALVWLHGGAFMFGGLDDPEADLTAREISAAGVPVVSVDYTLAPLDALGALPPFELPEGVPAPPPPDPNLPRAHYPVAALQTVAAFDWAVEHAAEFGAGADAVYLGGASAGGNIAAGAVLRLRDRGEATPAGQALIYPLLHHEVPRPEPRLLEQLTDVPAHLRFPPETTQAFNRNYLGGSVPDGYAFPADGNVEGSPRSLIVTADVDELRPSGEAFATQLIAAGVDTRCVRVAETPHGFLNMPDHPVRAAAVRGIAEFILQH